MKPKSALRSYLAIAGSSLLAISYSHAQTPLANSYVTSLDVSSPVTLLPAANFPSFMVGPLTGSSNLTINGLYTQSANAQGTVSLTNNGNTFDGNIIVDSGTLRIAGNPFIAGGFSAPSMTSSDTITLNRAGVLTIDDTVTNGYVADRFGSPGNRPVVNLAGGTINLTGRNNATSSVQTFGALTVSSGQAAINVTRSNGNPTLTFPSLSISKGAVANFSNIALGTGTNDPRVTFTSAPTLTNGIIAGAKVWAFDAGNGAFATYDNTNGVKLFTAFDVVSNDINTGTSSTTNFQMTEASTPAALTADRAVNSLNYRANGGTWSLGGFKLTLTSGMFLRNGTNGALTINNGTLTAGNGTDAIDLHIFTAQQNATIDAVIADNASSVVTLVKSHGNALTVSGGANNTYTGGTYVVDGSLTTGNVANRTYLGTGKVTVDGSGNLTLQAIGATSFSGSLANPTYTVTNGGKIQIFNANHGATEFYNIGANSIIAASGGTAGAGVGLASLTRGTNITLAPGAIIGHPNRASALNLANGTVQNIGTAADLFYGLNADQTNSGGQLNIGSGTAFRGISTDRSDRSWQVGTIDIAAGTTSVEFQGHAGLANAVVLSLGNGTTAGGPVISFAGTGTVDIKAIGRLQLNDDAAVYGDTSASKNIRFVATPGSILLVNQATGMGSGANGVASALVQNGGTLAITNAAALNGAVTVQAGGQFNANQALGLTGAGALTFNEGSIILIGTNAVGFSGTQATSATINPGTLVRAAVGSFGAASQTLDSILGSGANSVTYMTQGNDAANPTSLGTAVYTLNKSGGGIGGVLTNDGVSGNVVTNRTIGSTVNGHIALGANGGVMAATTNTTLQINENISGAGSLTIGTSAIIDGAPKLGTVILTTTASDYTGGTIVSVGTLQTNAVGVLGSNTGQLTVNTGGTLNLNNQNQTVGNLTGTGGVITGGNTGSRTLTIGQGNNGGGNFQGSITNGTGGTTLLTKTGSGTITLSGNNSYTGLTTVSGGVLKLNHATALSGGIGTTGGTSALTINTGGVVGLANGDFTRGIGTGVTQFQITGTGGGFAAYGADRTVTPGTLNFGTTAGTNILGALTLSAADADSTLIWSSNIGFAGSQRTVQVNNGSAAIDGRLSGVLSGLTSSGIDKTGAGTLELTNSSNSYTGSTTVSAGTLRLGASNVLFDTTEVASIVTIAAATLDVGAGVTDSTGVAPLDVAAAATINLGDGSSQIAFADSSAVDWTGGTLNITGTFVSGSSIRFGTTSGGLSGAQLSNIITLNSVPTSFSLNGSGFLVSGGAPVGYAAWQAANGTAGTRDQDHDGDGVDNGTEHFLGGTANTTGFTALPGVTNTAGVLSVTWTKAGTYTGSYTTDFVVETSTTLADPWTIETSPGNVTIVGNNVTYTFPGGPAYTGKRFARLKVTGP